MNITAHAVYAFLPYNLIYWLVYNTYPLAGMCVLVILFGCLPDFDYFYWKIKQKSKLSTASMEFQHHLMFPTHWPLTYFPLIIVFIVAWIFNYFPEWFFIPVIGVYSHMIFDSISCGDGLMWGKIPWKKGQYGRFINLLSKKTDGYHGKFWEARYKQTIFFKMETIAALISIIICLIYILLGGSLWYLFVIFTFSVMVYIGFKKPSPEYYEEPEQGRYADYRKNPDYIAYFKKKG